MSLPVDGARLSDLLLLDRVERAYRQEAELLDDDDMAAWSNWLDEDFRYEVPIPVSRGGAPPRAYSERGLFAVETKPTIELWVRRVSEANIGTAYAENSAIRTRHFVTNVRIRDVGRGVLRVSSNVLLSWNHRGEPPTFASAERSDLLVMREEEFTLRSRRVLLDCDVVHLNHLRVIF